MNDSFFDHPILNSPYKYPKRHWELDAQGQPTQQIIESRRQVDFITPIPQPRKRKTKDNQQRIVFDEGLGLSTEAQQYSTSQIINELRREVDAWRQLPDSADWHVTPETKRLLSYWRHHKFSNVKSFFCQLEALYGHYQKTFDLWQQAGVRALPYFIVVCNNTSTSKLVYDYISGFQQEHEDGSSSLVEGRLPLFRNYDEHGNPLARPRTLLIDSEQLESGDALDKDFRSAAADEIERFKREIIERTGDRRAAESMSEEDLLREVMNTVGREDRLGESIRCVVSVSMLTEGWDTNTVTHVLGVRAFGTQLLCEQVVGRALRRQSYDLNDEGLFNVEYADVLGIPFDFTAEPVISKPQPPRETINVRAVSPERDPLEIQFPRVQGYRVELPEERLTASFTDDSRLELTPDLVGPSVTHVSGIIGEGADLNLEHLEDTRSSTVLFNLTRRLLLTKWRDPGQDPKLHLFGQLKRITKQWLDGYLVCKGGTYPAQLMYQELADMACERITAAITRSLVGERPIKALLDPYNPTGSTAHVNFNTSARERWQTDSRKCHLNWIVYQGDWEAEFCRVAEAHPRVRAYVKNHNLGLEVPYRYGFTARK